MVWCRTDPVQEIGAIILIGKDALARLRQALDRRPVLRSRLTAEIGRNWAALFAGTLSDESDVVLPRIADAISLYKGAGGWWLPIGVRLDVPPHVEAPMIAAMASEHGIQASAVAIPRFGGFDRAATADVYAILDPRSIASEDLERLAA